MRSPSKIAEFSTEVGRSPGKILEPKRALDQRPSTPLGRAWGCLWATLVAPLFRTAPPRPDWSPPSKQRDEQFCLSRSMFRLSILLCVGCVLYVSPVK